MAQSSQARKKMKMRGCGEDEFAVCKAAGQEPVIETGDAPLFRGCGATRGDRSSLTTDIALLLQSIVRSHPRKPARALIALLLIADAVDGRSPPKLADPTK